MVNSERGGEYDVVIVGVDATRFGFEVTAKEAVRL